MFLLGRQLALKASGNAFVAAMVALLATSVAVGVGPCRGGGRDESSAARLSSAYGQDLGWNRTYGVPGLSCEARAMGKTADGGYVLAGYASSGGYDFWLVKIDAYGSMEWNNTYGGDGPELARSVVQTSDGGYMLAGDTAGYDVWLVKTDFYGNMEWNRTYGGSGYECAYSVRQTIDGGYVVAGDTTSYGAGNYDFYLIKTDGYGDMEWNKTYGGSDSDMCYCVRQTSDGGYVLCGLTYSFTEWSVDMWIVKTDASGNPEWGRISGWWEWDIANSVQQTSDGGYIVAGWRFSDYTTREDFWLVKLNQTGWLEWDKVYPRGPGEEQAQSVVQTSDGGYILAGSLSHQPSTGDWDFHVVKTDGYGSMQWSKTFNRTTGDRAYSVVEIVGEGYAVAGKSGGDSWLIKIVPYHDVAVLSLSFSKTTIGQDCTFNVTVTAANPGYFIETFNVTVFLNQTRIAAGEVRDLVGNGQATITITCNVTGISNGNYTVMAYAEPVTDEIDTSDNTAGGQVILVTVPGDVDGNRLVDIYDVVMLTAAYEAEQGQQGYTANKDITEDGVIDIYDVVTCTSHYEETW